MRLPALFIFFHRVSLCFTVGVKGVSCGLNSYGCSCSGFPSVWNCCSSIDGLKDHAQTNSYSLMSRQLGENWKQTPLYRAESAALLCHIGMTLVTHTRSHRKPVSQHGALFKSSKSQNHSLLITWQILSLKILWNQ